MICIYIFGQFNIGEAVNFGLSNWLDAGGKSDKEIYAIDSMEIKENANIKLKASFVFIAI
jgi:hypothetical protein